MNSNHPPAIKFFNVYDRQGDLRRAIDNACQRLDTNRSQLVRHAVRDYLKKHEAN